MTGFLFFLSFFSYLLPSVRSSHTSRDVHMYYVIGGMSVSGSVSREGGGEELHATGARIKVWAKGVQHLALSFLSIFSIFEIGFLSS